MKSVVVACGGSSLERGISLDSGHRVAHSLTSLGYRVDLVDVGADFTRRLLASRPSFVYSAMHGAEGEGGALQDLLEVLGIPYTGSGAPASALCLDKHLFKAMCVAHDLPTPPWHSFTRGAINEYGASACLPFIVEEFPSGIVVKPSRQGSSLGITVAHDQASLRTGILAALNYDDRILLERYVPGRELAVTVLGPPTDPEVLPVVELIYADEIYSFAAHYEIGAADVVKASLDPAVEERVKDVASRAYRLAGCRDVARVDIRLDADRPTVLEINTIPGMTLTGPAPLSADIAGIGFDQFVGRICRRVEGL